ncbi:MAG: acyl-CoA dehydrogenase family protein [Emcibacter sp.]|nr:acyl-CoA dehydrogenase family protein [Emcibacter sp.]
MMRETLRKFIEKEMPRDKVRRWDKARYFPKKVFQKLSELGVCGLTVAEE